LPPLSFLMSSATNFTAYVMYIKPIIDFILALLLVVITFPLVILLTLLLFIANNGSPFFFQLRPGKNEKIFKLIKFRTMNNRRGADGELLPDSVRLTKIGKFVRRTSLDELPQLFSVLKGDMSLVGPRPLLVEYLPLYNEQQRKRHNVKPGITGWAQINGRNALSWKQKFEYDVWYVENISPALDFKILFKTLQKVVKSDGITSATSATMEKFTGNNI